MAEETNQPTQQLPHEKSLTPLLREATDLLALFLSSEETPSGQRMRGSSGSPALLE